MSLDIQSVNGGKEIKVDLWFGNRETIAAIRLDASFSSKPFVQ
jgi:hypothetical protein